MSRPSDPSPLDIWRRCCEIQATWTRREERYRRNALTEFRGLPVGPRIVPFDLTASVAMTTLLTVTDKRP